MSANKSKIIAQAQKLAAQGKFDKAIAEYEKVVKDDPSDIRTWLKMGDLFTRMGSRGDATATYIKVAEQYQKAGFHLKAVAVYKQIVKIDPTLIEVYKMLADAYMHLGLTSEALIQLEQLADLYQRGGQSAPMLDALSRMAEINPGNVATRLRIAEQQSKEGNTPEAVTQFRLACDQLREQGRVDDFLKVAERLMFHAPDATDIAREAAGYYLESRQFKRALAKLQLCFSKDHRDIVTLELLAEAFVGLGQPEKSISVYNEIAHVIGEGGDQAKRRQIHERILALDPANQAALAALGRGQSVPTRVLRPAGDALPSPAAVPAAAQAATASAPLAVVENLDELSDEEITSRAQKILGETEVLLKYGLIDRAVDHLSKTFEFDFYNLDAREKLRDVLLEAGRTDEALGQLFVLVDGFVEDQPEGAVYYLHQILEVEPTNDKAIDILHRIGGVVPEHVARITTTAREEAEDFEFEADGFPESGEVAGPLLVEPEIGADDDLLDGFDDEDDTAQIDLDVDDAEEDLPMIDDDVADEDIFDLDDSLALDAPARDAARDELSGLDLSLDLEDVEDSGLAEVDAEDEIEVLEETVEPPKPSRLPRPAEPPKKAELSKPAKPAEPAKKVELPKKTEPVRPSEPPRRSEPPRMAHQPVAPKRAAPPAPKAEPAAAAEPAIGAGDLPDLSAELEEIDFFVSQELFDEARGILDDLLAEHPDDPRLAHFVDLLRAPAKDSVPAPAPALPTAAVAEAEYESDEIVVEDFDGDDEDVLDFDQLAEDLDQLVDDLDEEGTTTDPAIVGFEEVFSQFKAGVQAQVSSTDFATHYDLGMAYKEMGLFDDAITEFELAGGDPGRRAQVAIMIGICHVGSDRSDEAIGVLSAALDLPEKTVDETLAVKYELAKAHEIRGDTQRAIDLYNEVLNEDPGFADVVERIDALGG